MTGREKRGKSETGRERETERERQTHRERERERERERKSKSYRTYLLVIISVYATGANYMCSIVYYIHTRLL